MKLVKADKSDLETILQMQTEAFMPMLQKYRDYETSPANESRRISFSVLISLRPPTILLKLILIRSA